MMNSKRNQTIAIARFLMYKHSLNQQLDGMTDEEYLADPIGLDVGSYVKDLMRYCPENVVDQVMEHQDALLRRLGTDYLSVIAFMPYEEDGGVRYISFFTVVIWQDLRMQPMSFCITRTVTVCR